MLQVSQELILAHLPLFKQLAKCLTYKYNGEVAKRL